MSHNSFTPSQLHHLCHQYILPLGHRDSQCHSAERSLWRTPFLQPCSCNETAGGNFIGRPYSVAVMPLSHWFVKLGKVFFRVVCEQIICSQVVRTADTSDETFEALMAFGKAMKKVTVSCKVWTWGHMTLSQCTLLVTWPITSQHFSSICDHLIWLVNAWHSETSVSKLDMLNLLAKDLHWLPWCLVTDLVTLA